MKQLLRSVGFILIFYSVAPNIIREMTLAQKIMFGLGASWLFYEGGGKKMIPKIETCEECGCKYKEGTSDYSSIFQTGYCGDCLVERVERGEEW